MSKPKAKLQIAHQVPGRIRMKIPSAKGDPARLEEYKETLSAIPGIESIEVNPDTGSVVLKYDPDQHHAFHSGFSDHVSRHHDYLEAVQRCSLVEMREHLGFKQDTLPKKFIG